jgi:hypothetical protein
MAIRSRVSLDRFLPRWKAAIFSACALDFFLPLPPKFIFNRDVSLTTFPLWAKPMRLLVSLDHAYPVITHDR